MHCLEKKKEMDKKGEAEEIHTSKTVEEKDTQQHTHSTSPRVLLVAAATTHKTRSSK